MTREDYEARVFYIATIIKCVACEDISKICKIAHNIKELYGDSVDDLNNELIYEAFCMEV